MPISQMRNGLTAENNLFSQKPSIKVSRSKFDLSRLNCFTSDVGAIVPVDLIPTLPGDDFDLSCQYKIDFRPLLVPTFTAYKVKVHYYYCPLQYLWSGWESFISKGRSGKLALTVPKLLLSKLNDSSAVMSGLTDSNFMTSDGSYLPYVSGSLLDYLVGSVPYDVGVDINEDSKLSVDHYRPFAPITATVYNTGYKALDTNLLPFLMYQKIYRSNYIDPNLMSNGIVESDVWFPDDIDSSDWRIGYSANNISGAFNHLFIPQNSVASDTIVANFVPKPQPVNDTDVIGDTFINLTQLRYSMYVDDMFTTALPFLQRGLQTSLDLSVVADNFFNFPDGDVYDLSGVSRDNYSQYAVSVGSKIYKPYNRVNSDSALTNYNNTASIYLNSEDGKNVPYSFVMSGYQNSGSTNFASGFIQGLSFNSDYFNSAINSGSLGVNFTAQQLRSLLALSVWQERNALTNGSYGQFIRVHFDNSPNNQYCEPIYIGGTTSLFNVSPVVQTSASVDNSTPQGNQVGIGGSSNGDNLGHFRASDFGYIMAVMSIIPDTFYVQSQEHWQFDTNPDDFYMPEYEQLSYQPILNKQLYVSGTDSIDNDLFGYSNRYVYLKQRDSIARGRFALPASVDSYYHSYVQSRVFSDTPKLSQNFVTVYPPNIDRSFLAYPSEPAFLVQYFSSVSAVRPLSYMSQPNTFGF